MFRFPCSGRILFFEAMVGSRMAQRQRARDDSVCHTLRKAMSQDQTLMCVISAAMAAE
jgi:hypothetical protein